MHGRQIAAIWCRVSTHDQRELSLESQEIAVKKVLTAQGYDVPPEYVLQVDWTSIDLMSCPKFQQLRRWIADGTVQAVGTVDRDRLQAQGLQRLVFLSECKDNGVEIITAQGPAMMEGGEGQLVELGPRTREGTFGAPGATRRPRWPQGPSPVEGSASQHEQAVWHAVGIQSFSARQELPNSIRYMEHGTGRSENPRHRYRTD